MLRVFVQALEKGSLVLFKPGATVASNITVNLMGLQRHIKVMGIFARLALRVGKRGYLQDLPLVIRYSLEAARDYPESRGFYDWFIQRIEPQLASQEWYSDWQTAGDNP